MVAGAWPDVVAGAEAKMRRSLFQRSYYSLGRSLLSLVPRPHPVMKKNDLVKQVEFIGRTFVTVSPSNVFTDHFSLGGACPQNSQVALFNLIGSSI